MMDFITSNPGLAIGSAAFICGAALLYLVSIRTMRNRSQDDQD